MTKFQHLIKWVGHGFLATLPFSNIFGQQKIDSSFRFYYYDQKLSFFQSIHDHHEDEIIWLGDSITDGGEWAELFPNQKNLNRGISSDNTFGILFRLKEVTARKPKRIFLLIGINDIAKKTPVVTILNNYRLIVEQIQKESPQTQLILQTLMPTNATFTLFPNHQNKMDIVKAVNAGIKQLAQDRNCICIDLFTAFQDKEGNLDIRFTNDGLHLTGEGYQHWKNQIVQQQLYRP